MKPIIDGGTGAAEEVSAAPDGGGTVAFGDRVRLFRQACRQIVGIPDYERYVAHMAKHHPGDPVLSREAFFVQSIDRRYGRSGPRCC